ncbi:MAG: hypothetical protein U0270_23675 [Labilithrix sp.]
MWNGSRVFLLALWTSCFALQACAEDQGPAPFPVGPMSTPAGQGQARKPAAKRSESTAAPDGVSLGSSSTGDADTCEGVAASFVAVADATSIPAPSGGTGLDGTWVLTSAVATAESGLRGTRVRSSVRFSGADVSIDLATEGGALLPCCTGTYELDGSSLFVHVTGPDACAAYRSARIPFTYTVTGNELILHQSGGGSDPDAPQHALAYERQ